MRNQSLKRDQLLHRFLHLVCSGLLLLLMSSLLATSFAVESDKDVYLLELHKPVEHELAGGQSHSYRIVLAAEQYLRVVAEQRGIDVVLTLFDPNGKQVWKLIARLVQKAKRSSR
jgi:hypothetical protein